MSRSWIQMLKAGIMVSRMRTIPAEARLCEVKRTHHATQVSVRSACKSSPVLVHLEFKEGNISFQIARYQSSSTTRPAHA